MPRCFPLDRQAGIPGGWKVEDGTGFTLVYVQVETAVGVEHLTIEEARRIAVNIAKQPELLGHK